MALNILVVGAGVCGPAVAFLLQRANHRHNITVIERTSSLRLAGQQVDLKNEVPYLLDRMGLLDVIKPRCVNETGLEVVDSNSKRLALFGVTPSGQRQIGLTSEFEIMRGDLVEVLYDASVQQDMAMKKEPGYREGITYQFGQTIETLDHNSEKGVAVSFSNGDKRNYDLVIAADGQASRTRQLAFGAEVNKASFHSIGVHAAYFSIPKVEGEGTLARINFSPGRSILVTRTSDRSVTGVLFFMKQKSLELEASYKESISVQKKAFSKVMSELSWQKDRITQGMNSSEDFYANELGQTKMEKLSTGRVVLIGDAGYGPTPFTGLGSTLGLLGAYILAGEIGKQGNNIPGAFKAYEEKMRPFINEYQALPTRMLDLCFPGSRFGIWLIQTALWGASKMSGLMPQGKEEKDYKYRLPDYPELKLAQKP